MLVINNIGTLNGNKYQSQRDPRWAEITLGSGQLKVGRYGCTTTCISMLSEFFGCYQDPGTIAKDKANYVGSDINWTTLHFPCFSFRWREGNYFGPSKIDMEMVKAYLAHGDNRKEDNDRAVILEVANRSHWVVGLWWNEQEKDILAIDPWTGQTCWVFKEYKNITGASFFLRSTKNEWRGKKAPAAPKYN